MLTKLCIIVVASVRLVCGLTVTSSDANSGNAASLAGDGNTGTFWHSQFSPTVVSLPHSATIDLGASTFINGFNYLPRQDGSLNGNIGQYKVEVSPDNSAWTLVASGTLVDDTSKKQIGFTAVTTS